MNQDMHHEATYFLLSASGWPDDLAACAAAACQYVDDNEKTAHHMADLASNLSRSGQLGVWVPFHFLPGCRGADLDHQLICERDGPVARSIMDAAARRALCFLTSPHRDQRRLGAMAFGISLHSYWDTFSHYGFSGVSSKLNRIDSRTIRILGDGHGERTPSERGDFLDRHGREAGQIKGLRKWWEILLDGFKSDTVELLSGALGHGAALTYPDKPHLRWSFRWERGRPFTGDSMGSGPGGLSDRNNTENCLAACRRVSEYARLVRDAVVDASRGEAWSPSTRTIDPERLAARLLPMGGSKSTRTIRWRAESAAAEGISIPDYRASDFPSKMGESMFIRAARMHRTIVKIELADRGVLNSP